MRIYTCSWSDNHEETRHPSEDDKKLCSQYEFICPWKPLLTVRLLSMIPNASETSCDDHSKQIGSLFISNVDDALI